MSSSASDGMSETGPVQKLRAARAGWLEIVGVAALLAVATNLLTTGLAEDLEQTTVVVIGSLVTAAILLSLAVVRLRGLSQTWSYDGVILIHKNEFVPIPDYAVSQDLDRTLRAALHENAAWKRQWDENPLGQYPVPPGGAGQLVAEALETVFFSSLSSHLSSYFTRRGLEKYCRILTRNDLLDILPGNRILDQQSRPMEDREAFNEAKRKAEGSKHFVTVTKQASLDEEGEVWLASDGTHIFRRIELVLPSDTTVKRVGPGHLELKGKSFKAEIIVTFDGMSGSVDPDFIGYYVGRPRHEFYMTNDGRIYGFNIALTTHIKVASLFRRRAARLYKWSEDFAATAREDVSFRHFLERIQWPTVKATLRVTRSLMAVKTQTPPRETAPKSKRQLAEKGRAPSTKPTPQSQGEESNPTSSGPTSDK